MTYWNERRVRLLLRLAMLVGAMLSAVSLASALHWVTIGREQTFALGFALAITSLCIGLPYRWLRNRHFAL
jgi:hypothetical protein